MPPRFDFEPIFIAPIWSIASTIEVSRSASPLRFATSSIVWWRVPIAFGDDDGTISARPGPLGTDFEIDAFTNLDQRAEISLGEPPGTFIEERNDGLQTSLGVYASGELRLGRLTLRPGVRASGFTVGPRSAFAVDPRGVALLELGDRWRLSVGLGRYSQVRSIADRNEIDLLSSSTGIEGANVFLPAAFGSLDPSATFAPEDTFATISAKTGWPS